MPVKVLCIEGYLFVLVDFVLEVSGLSLMVVIGQGAHLSLEASLLLVIVVFAAGQVVVIDLLVLTEL